MRLILIAQMDNRSLGAGRIVPRAVPHEPKAPVGPSRESGLSERGTMRLTPRRSAVVPIWG